MVTYEDPFGRMGGGAPLRDSSGHVLADRGNVFDRVSIFVYNNTPNMHSNERIQKWAHDPLPGNKFVHYIISV